MTYAIYSKQQEIEISKKIIQESAEAVFGDSLSRVFNDYENSGLVRGFSVLLNRSNIIPDYPEVSIEWIVKFLISDVYYKVDKRKKNTPKSLGSFFVDAFVKKNEQDLTPDVSGLLSSVKLEYTRNFDIEIPHTTTSNDGHSPETGSFLCPINQKAVEYIMQYFLSSDKMSNDIASLTKALSVHD